MEQSLAYHRLYQELFVNRNLNLTCTAGLARQILAGEVGGTSHNPQGKNYGWGKKCPIGGLACCHNPSSFTAALYITVELGQIIALYTTPTHRVVQQLLVVSEVCATQCKKIDQCVTKKKKNGECVIKMMNMFLRRSRRMIFS